jgi:hypothetical protein
MHVWMNLADIDHSKADHALYEAKRIGRNRFCVHTDAGEAKRRTSTRGGL